jgi:hypothetical protein
MNYEIWENGGQAMLAEAEAFTLCTLRRGGWRIVEVLPNQMTKGDAMARLDAWIAEQDPVVGSTERAAQHILRWHEQRAIGIDPTECTCGEHSPTLLAEAVLALHQPHRQGAELQFTIDKAKNGLGRPILRLMHSLPTNAENGERDADSEGTQGET